LTKEICIKAPSCDECETPTSHLSSTFSNEHGALTPLKILM
jgi:hypothetical protein